MSGGIAYVLTSAVTEQRCNLAMVELEPIAAEADALNSSITRAATWKRMGWSTSAMA
jgi:glutamate synthase domain-containing protein 3